MKASTIDRGGALIVALFIAAFCACTAFFTLNPHLLGGPSGIRVSMDEDFGEGWVASDGTPVTLSSLQDLPDFSTRGARISKRLPDRIETGIELNFISSNVMLQLLYDGVLVYAHHPDPTVLGMPYGSHFNFAPLSSSDANKLVTLVLEPVYTDSAAQIFDVRLSGTSTYIQRYVCNHGIAFLMSLTVVFIGLAVIVMHLAMRSTSRSDLDLLSLAAISIMLGIWSGAQTLVLQIVTGLAPLIRALEYAALLFSPYPLVRFVGSLIRVRARERYDRIALVAMIASVLLTMVLAAFFRYDMHQLLGIAHVQMVLCAVLTILEIVAGFRKHGKSLWHGVQQANRAILLAFLLFVACCIIDFIAFNVSAHGVLDSGFFMRIGLFVLVIVLAVEAFRTSTEFIKRADHADAVEAIAYMDALTGIGNRTAWQIMRNEMDDALAEGIVDDALICQIDVNFLKKVNDTYGHAAGDEHLKRAADTINRSFGTEGACYRTGGDEFTVVIVGIMLDERLQQCNDLLELSMREQDEMHEGAVPLSMAIGCARVSEVTPTTLKAAQLLADKRMYANKRAMHAERTD